VLPELYQRNALTKSSANPSPGWYEAIIRQFETVADSKSPADVSEQATYECNAFLESTHVLDVPTQTKEKISALLFDSLNKALQLDSSAQVSPAHLLATGSGFQFLVQNKNLDDGILQLWPSLCAASAIYGHYLPFWQALLGIAEQNKGTVNVAENHKETFRDALMRCISSPSHDLRLAGLGLIQIVMGQGEQQRDAIATALLIEQTPLNLENVRSVSMRIRQLAKCYPTMCTDEWIGEAIPFFCFGLLHVKFAQVWDDACSALKEICETKDGEAYVSKIALSALSGHEPQGLTLSSIPENEVQPQRASEFQCTNIMHLEQKVAEHQSFLEDTKHRLMSTFEKQHTRVPFLTTFSRSQALRVLSAAPQVAEKRSRFLVPILLQWALNQPATDDVGQDTNMAEENDAGELRWARKDQKELLSVFAKFTNPKVLYRTSEVYDALLILLANGDVEIQKAALKAILTWKNPAITRYQENLFNLLDDARFREEISVFMDVGDEESHLQEQHRQELLPVILRLLYGKVISGRRGQEAKRKAVFIALTRFKTDAIRQFLSIAFGPLSGISILSHGRLDESLFENEIMNPRKQLGMLNMLEDMLTTLKTTLTPFTSVVINPLLYCLIRTYRGLSSAATSSNSEEEAGRNAQLSLLRTIRQRAFHSLNILFESCADFSWDEYMPAIVEELVTPRLQQFPIETAQSVSGLLRLFASWSKSPQTALYLVRYDHDILNKIVNCLDVPSAKDEVKIYILDQVLRSVISTAASSVEGASTEAKIQRNRIHSEVLQPYANGILVNVGNLLKKSPSREVLESGVHTVAELAPLIVGAAEARSMIEIGTFLLRQPSRRVNAQTKLGVLKILHQFVPRCDSKDLEELFESVFESSSSMFASFQDRTTRELLCNIVQDLSTHHEELDVVANLCHDLNSFSQGRLDEPDFDRRSNAYNAITQDRETPFTLRQWKPLVYNMIFFVKDNEDLSIRVNASLSLRKFIEASTADEAFKVFLSSALLPGLQNGMRESSELVRVEFLTILAQLVKVHSNWPPIADLNVLLGPDEEASFFGNVLHIQGHRRLRALRRLVSHASQLQSGNVYHILLPLLEHFIFNKADEEGANNLAGEAVRAVSALSEWLEWPQFRSMLKRFTGYLTSKEDMQKTIIRLLVGMMDSLNQAGQAKGYLATSASELVQDKPAEIDGEDAIKVDKPISSTLARTLPQQEKLNADLTGNLLPPLTDFLHNKDESTVSLRVPIATAVTKILLVLPTREIEARLPSVLLDISHILKSKSQDGRDMARTTLSEIAMLTGPTYLSFILKSLRTALQRGYQLHVLSFTLHHILVKMSPQLKPGDLDYCLPEIVDVIMDDIFGVTGQEKDAEEYISKMKEVKSSKSYDSMDLISRATTPTHLVDLILPVKSLLQERLNSKIVSKIDELLRRIGLGILQNPTVQDRDILVFCYELVQEVYRTSANPRETKQDDSKNKRYLVNMRGAAKSGVRGSSSTYIYKLTRFSLDILRTVLRKHQELQTVQNMAGFLPILGDALVQGQEEVQIAAVRLLTTIIKIPLPALDQDCPVYVTEAVNRIRNAPSTNTELPQASLKMISAILRERPNVTIKERDLAYLLKRIMPDLDEPDRQGATFGLLKAVMNRNIVVTEIYEVMDKVAEMMITNQTRSARDLSRSNYFYFLMNYPQAKNRFNKQLQFLLRNLRYDYVEGRQSVMEALNLILTKVGDNILQDVLGTMFIPLVHSMVNDDSSDCRTMAGALVKTMFERADAQRLKSLTSDLREWLEQDEDTGLKRLGIQCWGLLFEAVEVKAKDLAFVLDHLQSTMEDCLARRDEDDWELIYYSLAVFAKLCKVAPETTLSSKREAFWSLIQTCVSYPHAWVKLTAAKLMGTLFADLGSTNGEAGLGNLPLESAYGLRLEEEGMVQLANAFLRNLSIPDVTEDICAQSVRNLAFLARCFAVNGAKWNWQKADDDDEGGDAAVEAPQDGANGAAESSDDGFEGFSPPPEKPALKVETTATPTAVHRLVTRLSGIIRRETKIMRLPSLYPKSAVLSLLETLALKLPIDSLVPSLPHLLTTLSTLTDPATTIPRSTDPSFNSTYQSLIDKAGEVLNALQKRMGAQEYVKVMGSVQKGVRERRDERRAKRKVEAVMQPEKWGKEKKRRHDVGRVKKKERSAEERGRRRGW
jgi:U3 small nucleolar RNA-associated protein 20